jgi:hypothetical protein
MTTLDRRAYAEMYGPTVGDRVRLGDTELLIEVERDYTVYGWPTNALAIRRCHDIHLHGSFAYPLPIDGSHPL